MAVEIKKDVAASKVAETPKTNTAAAETEAAKPLNSVFLPGYNAFGMGANPLNPGWSAASLQQEYVPVWSALFSMPPFFAPQYFNGVFSSMFEKFKTYFQGGESQLNIQAPPTVEKKPEVKDETTKLLEQRVEAYKLGIPYDEKDTSETLKVKVDKAKADAETTAKKPSDDKSSVQTNKNSGKGQQSFLDADGNGVKDYTDSKTGNKIHEEYKHSRLVAKTTYFKKDDFQGGHTDHFSEIEGTKYQDGEIVGTTALSGKRAKEYTNKDGDKFREVYENGKLTSTIIFRVDGSIEEVKAGKTTVAKKPEPVKIDYPITAFVP